MLRYTHFFYKNIETVAQPQRFSHKRLPLPKHVLRFLEILSLNVLIAVFLYNKLSVVYVGVRDQ